MKRILLFMLLMCSMSAWAQDVIVKRDGAAVICRIINVSSLEIVYKKWTDLEGPNLVMSIAEAASITYENGEKKVFENVATTQPLPIVQKNSDQQTVSDEMLLKMVEKPEKSLSEKTKIKVKRLKIAGWATGGVMVATGLSLLAGGIINEACNGSDDFLFIAGMPIGIPFMAASFIPTTACLVKANKIKKKEAQLSVQSAPVFQQEFHLKNGSILSPSINMLKDNTRHNQTLGFGLAYNF